MVNPFAPWVGAETVVEGPVLLEQYEDVLHLLPYLRELLPRGQAQLVRIARLFSYPHCLVCVANLSVGLQERTSHDHALSAPLLQLHGQSGGDGGHRADSLRSRVICETLLKQCWVHGRGPALAAAWHDVVRRGAAVRRTGMMVGRGLGRYGWPHDGCVSLISCHHS